ncbi:MAG: hypothetical protein ACXQTL_06130 [Methanosarcinales archaeon]
MKILVDLDKTLTKEPVFPEIGEPNPEVIDALKRLQDEEFEIVIYTSRSWWSERDIVKWCLLNGLVPNEIICGKPVGILVDDLAVNPRGKDEESLYREIKQRVEEFKEDWERGR